MTLVLVAEPYKFFAGEARFELTPQIFAVRLHHCLEPLAVRHHCLICTSWQHNSACHTLTSLRFLLLLFAGKLRLVVHAHVELSRYCALLCVWLSARLPADEHLSQMHLNFMRQNGLWQAPVEREEKFVKVAEARHAASPLSSQLFTSVSSSATLRTIGQMSHLQTSTVIFSSAWQSS